MSRRNMAEILPIRRKTLSDQSINQFHSSGDAIFAGEGLQKARHLQPLRREGTLSCHICCDMGPRHCCGLIRSKSPFTSNKRYLGLI